MSLQCDKKNRKASTLLTMEGVSVQEKVEQFRQAVHEVLQNVKEKTLFLFAKKKKKVVQLNQPLDSPVEKQDGDEKCQISEVVKNFNELFMELCCHAVLQNIAFF